MGGFFYELGRLFGPSIRKGTWFFRSFTGSEEEIIRAEAEVGRDLAAAFRRELPADEDPAWRGQVNALGARLAARVKDKLRRFEFTIVAGPAPNAFALPGGYIFVTRPLLDLVGRGRDELAFVLAHEMAHVIRQDPMERALADATIAAALRALPAAGAAGTWLPSLAGRLLQSSYSQDRELAADELGARLAHAAGFDPRAAIRMLEQLKATAAAAAERTRGEGRGAVREGELPSYFGTHPPFDLRIRELARLTGGR